MRLSIVLVGGAFVTLDQPAAVVFATGFAFCGAVVAASHAIPRLQVRLARLRGGARRA